MNIEDPLKYSLQLSTCEAILHYSRTHKVSNRVACDIAFSNLKKRRFNKRHCGFNLKSPVQFYSSFRRFKSLKMSSVNRFPP